MYQDLIYGIRSVALALTLLCSSAVLAQTDSTAPLLTKFSFTEAAVDAASGKTTVKVSYTVTDDISGASVLQVDFGNDLDGATGVSSQVPLGAQTAVSGTMDVAFPLNGPAGSWTVAQVRIVDSAGNESILSTSDLAAAGFATQMAAPPLAISLSDQALSFNSPWGQGSPQTKSILLAANIATNFSVATGTAGNWLSVSPSGGTTPGNLAVTMNPAGLTPGTYKATLTITAPAAANSPQTVLVTLTVGSVSTISVAPGRLSFTYLIGGTLPPSQGVTLSGSGATAFAAAASGGAWLSVTPTGGPIPTTLAVSVNPAGLNAGSYSGTITLTAPGAGNSPLPVPVTLVVMPAPTLSTSPASISVTYTIGDPVPAAKTLSVAATAAQAFTAIATGGAWLSVAPSSGTTPASVAVSVNPAGLPAGSYSGTILIAASGAGSNPLSVPVNLTVAPAPAVNPSPSSVSVSYRIGDALPSAQLLSVGGTAGLKFTAAAQPGAPWLSITPAYGTTPASMLVMVNPAGLTVGTHTGVINIAAPGAKNSPQTVAVRLTVTPRAVIATPSSVTFSYRMGDKAPAAQAVDVGGSPGLAFSITTTGESWFSVTPLAGATSATLAVAVNPAGLSPGVYNGAINITAPLAGNSPLAVPVSLTVSPPPSLAANPVSIPVSYRMGDAAPAARTLFVGGTDGLAFTITATGRNWLSVTPSSGITPTSLTVSINPTGLAAGSYQGTISIASTQASNNPLTVPVNLTVAAPPSLSPTPALISVAYQLGDAVPAAQTLTVGGTAGLAFSATATGGNWLSITPSSGTTPAGLSVAVNPTGLAAGTYKGTISIASSGASNSPRNVPVTLTVTPAPTVTVSPSQLSFEFKGKTSPPSSRTVAVAVAGAGATSFSVSANGGTWLSASPSSGSTPAALIVSANPSGLNPGTYSGTVIIAAPGGNTVIGVTLSVGSATGPAIGTGGVVNGASFVSGLAPGSWGSIFGQGFVPAGTSVSWTGDDIVDGVLPTSLGGIQVLVDGKPSAISYVGPTQINFQAPDTDNRGPVLVEVITADGTATATTEMYQAVPALFVINSASGLLASAVHLDGTLAARPDLVPHARPAQVGETLMLFGTGFGPTNPSQAAGSLVEPAELQSKVQVLFGQTEATVLWSGIVAPGLYQFNVVVPEVPAGDVPISFLTDGLSTQPGVVLSVTQ